MRRILLSVLPHIKPSPQEMLCELVFAQSLVDQVRKAAPRGCDVVLTGSVAKKTFLRDKKDVDIFVLFDRSVPHDSLEPSIESIMKTAFPRVGYQLSYAEHPYVRFHFEGRRIDLVPAYRISDASERLSAVDRSVLHTRFVRASLKSPMIDQVLLLKSFLRANSLYGAEIKIHGFSGYLCELLIIKYKTFPNLVRAAPKWKIQRKSKGKNRSKGGSKSTSGPVFIDIKKYYKTRSAIRAASERLGALNGFVMIDPTDRDRNVAAALSPENLRRFIALCKQFLRKPSPDFFLRDPPCFETRVARLSTVRGSHPYLITMPRPDVVDDVLWGQLQRMIKQMGEHLEDFQPKHMLADDSRHLVRLALILGKDTLSPSLLLEGPPMEMTKHVKSFRSSHKRAKFLIKKKRLYAVVRRPVRTAEQAIQTFLNSFRSCDSHLAYPEELFIVEKGLPKAKETPQKQRRPQ